MTFNPIIPTFSVEDLFSKYAVCNHRESDNITQGESMNDAKSENAALPQEKFDHPILAPVIEVLNYTRLIDVDDVAKQLKVNGRKLSAAVELHTGKTLHCFIFDWRFMQSQQLLLDTELPYSEIAARCGFANETVLIKQYKSRLQTTPHTFRTGYRIRNSNYSFNRHGYQNRLNGECRGAKNKVYYSK